MAKDPLTDLHLSDSRAQIARTRRHLAVAERHIAATLGALERSRQLLERPAADLPAKPRRNRRRR